MNVLLITLFAVLNNIDMAFLAVLPLAGAGMAVFLFLGRPLPFLGSPRFFSGGSALDLGAGPSRRVKLDNDDYIIICTVLIRIIN